MKKKIRKVREDKWNKLSTMQEVFSFIRARQPEVIGRAYAFAHEGHCDVEYPQLKHAIFSTMLGNKYYWYKDPTDQDIAFLIGEIYSAL